MADCLDNVNLECGCMGDGASRRNLIASIAAGTIFSIGWWLVIDAAAVHPTQAVRSRSSLMPIIRVLFEGNFSPVLYVVFSLRRNLTTPTTHAA